MAKSTFFSPVASNKLHRSESKKRDANEILLSMSVPDDAISAVLFLLSNLKAQISFQKSKNYAVMGILERRPPRINVF